MIVGEYFENDPTWVAWIQHDLYGETLGHLFSTAREKYEQAEKVIGIETALGEDMKAVKGFDHRTLQYTHDMIAAHFRYLHRERVQPYFPGMVIVLSDEEQVRTVWRQYYPGEIKRLLSEFPILPRLILTAAVYPNPDDRGIEAEDQLYQLMKEIYPVIGAFADKKYKQKANDEQ